MSNFPTLDLILGSGGSGSGKLTVPAGTLTAGQVKAVVVKDAAKTPDLIDVLDAAGIVLLPGNTAPTGSAKLLQIGTDGSAAYVDPATVGSSSNPQVDFKDRGSWVASTAYIVNDVYVQALKRYHVDKSYTSGTTFGSADLANVTYMGLDSAVTTTSGLSVAPMQTASFSASPGNLYPVDAKSGTTGNVAVTLPTGPAGGNQADIVVLRADNGQTTVRRLEIFLPGSTTDPVATLNAGDLVTMRWTGTAYVAGRNSSPSNLLVTPGMKNADGVFGVGVPGALAAPPLRQPPRTLVKPLFLTTDVTFATSGGGSTGTQLLQQSPDPWHHATPGGNPQMTVTSNGTYTVGHMTAKLTGPVDMTKNPIISTWARIATNDQSKIRNMEIQVSSDNFATANYHRFSLTTNEVAHGCWRRIGGDVVSANAMGTGGADLTKINAIRLKVETFNTAGNWTITVDWAEYSFGPRISNRPKVVLWFDDGYVQHWQTVYPVLRRFNLPYTIAHIPAQDDTLTAEQVRRMQVGGVQIGSHAWQTPQHTTVDAATPGFISPEQFEQGFALSQHAAMATGVRGVADWAWWGGLKITEFSLKTINRWCRSGRWNTSNGATVAETLPPQDHRLTGAYLTGAEIDTDPATAITHVQKAIANNGLAQLVWHNTASTTSFRVGWYRFFDWLDKNRDVVDVVTAHQAYKGYTVNDPDPVWYDSTGTVWTPAKPAAPAAPTVTAGAASVVVALPATLPSTVGNAPITRFLVWRSSDGGTTWTQVVPTATTTVLAANLYDIEGGLTQITDTTAVTGTAYKYALSARNAAGESAMGAASSTVTPT